MQIKLIHVGKTTTSYLQQAVQDFRNRLTHYTKLQIVTIPHPKNTKNQTPQQIQQQEAEQIQRHINSADNVILLHEKGKQYTSQKLAQYIQTQNINSVKNLSLVIGGPYGFSQEILTKYLQKISLSTMTFTHEFALLILLEQLYRAYTIINHHPYHNE